MKQDAVVLYSRLAELQEKKNEIITQNQQRGTPKEEREKLLRQVRLNMIMSTYSVWGHFSILLLIGCTQKHVSLNRYNFVHIVFLSIENTVLIKLHPKLYNFIYILKCISVLM